MTGWMQQKGHTPFSFQKKAWKKYGNGYSGMVVVTTGFGKTFSIFHAVLIDFMNKPSGYEKGLNLLWMTALRSLAKDLARAMQEDIDENGLDWEVEVRNGDTDIKIRQRQ